MSNANETPPPPLSGGEGCVVAVRGHARSNTSDFARRGQTPRPELPFCQQDSGGRGPGSQWPMSAALFDIDVHEGCRRAALRNRRCRGH